MDDAERAAAISAAAATPKLHFTDIKPSGAPSIHKLKKRKKRSKTKTNAPDLKKRRLITKNTPLAIATDENDEECDIRLIYFKNMIDFTPTLPPNSFMSVDLNQNEDMNKFIKTCYPYTFNELYDIIFFSCKDILIRNQQPQPQSTNDHTSVDNEWEIIDSHCSVEIVVSKLSRSEVTMSLPLLSFDSSSDPPLPLNLVQNKGNCRRWRNIIWGNWTLPNNIQWFIFTIFPLLNRKMPSMSKIKLAALIYQNSYNEFYKNIFTSVSVDDGGDEDDDYSIGRTLPQSVVTKKDGLILIVEKTGKWGKPVGVYLCYDITKKTQKQLINGVISQISLHEGTVSKLYYISPFGCKKMTEINMGWVKENKTCAYIFIPINISTITTAVVATTTTTTTAINDKKNIKNLDSMMNFIIYLEKHGCSPRKYTTKLNQHIYDNKPDYSTLTPSATTMSTLNNSNNNRINEYKERFFINRQNHINLKDYNDNKYTLSPDNNECINMHYNSLLWKYGNCSQIEGEIIVNLLKTTLQQIEYENTSGKKLTKYTAINGIIKGKIEQHTVFKNVSTLALLKYLTLWPSVGKFDFILTNHRVFLEERISSSGQQQQKIDSNSSLSLSTPSSTVKKYVYDGYGSVAVPLNPHYIKYNNERVVLTSEWFYKHVQHKGDHPDVNMVDNVNWLLTLSSSSSLRSLQNLSSILKIKSLEEEFQSFHWFIKMLIIFFDDDNRAYLFSNFYTEQEEKEENESRNSGEEGENSQSTYSNGRGNNFEEEDNGDDDYYYISDNKKRKKHKRFHRQQQQQQDRHRRKSTVKLMTISEKILFNMIFEITCDRLTFTTAAATTTNLITNNKPLLYKLASKLLKNPQLTHPFFIQLGFYIVSKHLVKSIRGCWFPNTPNTLMKLYNRQYQDGIQPKERIFLLAIDNINGDNVYWILKFKWEYSGNVSRVHPYKTRVFLLYTSKNPSSKKIQELDLYYLETKILPHVIFFIWPNLFE